MSAVVYDIPGGRFGNAVFRYLASSLYASFYNLKRVNKVTEPHVVFGDQAFLTWTQAKLDDQECKFNINSDKSICLIFRGYFQHDKIFVKYKEQLKQWIQGHPDDLLITDGNCATRTEYNYDVHHYKAIEILRSPKNIVSHEVCVHLRLEDFITYDMVMHPKSLDKLLSTIVNSTDKVCFVVKNVTTDLEKQYINYFRNKYNIHIQSGTVSEDYHTLRNAKILVCSCSTLSWIASLFSETVETVYFPNIDNPSRTHETFKQPIKNTIIYDYETCSQAQLKQLFSFL